MAEDRRLLQSADLGSHVVLSHPNGVLPLVRPRAGIVAERSMPWSTSEISVLSQLATNVVVITVDRLVPFVTSLFGTHTNDAARNYLSASGAVWKSDGHRILEKGNGIRGNARTRVHIALSV